MNCSGLGLRRPRTPVAGIEVYGGHGCINAGVMRLDALPTAAERRWFTEEILSEVAKLAEWDQSYLPEQYFLSKDCQIGDT